MALELFPLLLWVISCFYIEIISLWQIRSEYREYLMMQPEHAERLNSKSLKKNWKLSWKEEEDSWIIYL
jgi:hypothetical protein